MTRWRPPILRAPSHLDFGAVIFASTDGDIGTGRGATRRVLQVIASTQRRGAEVFGTELGRALTERGWSVRTVALAPYAGGGLNVESLGDKRLAMGTLRALRAAALTRDVVVAHGSSTLPACALATVGTRTPFVYRNIGDPQYWSASAGRRARVCVLLHQARAVAVLWKGAADVLVDRLKVPERKIRVIPNGVAASLFPPVDAAARLDARRRLELDGVRHVVLYAGALSPEKLVATAIEAIGRIEHAHLLVAGDGPLRSELVGRAAALAPGRVHFLGEVAELAPIMAAVDAVVLPSRTEGMPAVLIEAGLSALPVVATDVGGVAEIVLDGQTGRLVRPGNAPALAEALRYVFTNPERLGAAARLRCLERFDMKGVADLWHQLLVEMCNPPRVKAGARHDAGDSPTPGR